MVNTIILQDFAEQLRAIAFDSYIIGMLRFFLR